MKKRLCFLIVTICLILMGGTAKEAYAQNPQTIEVGPHVGVTSYIGELNAWRNIPDWNLTHQFYFDYGGLVRYNYDTRWSFRLDYTHLDVRACDTTASWRPEAMLNFRSTINDLSLMVEFNFLDYYTGHMENVVSPYIFGGFSAFIYQVHPYTGNELIDSFKLNALATEDYFNESAKPDDDDKYKYLTKDLTSPAYSFSIPFGVGCKMSLSQHLAATVEWRMHYTFTDYLDDVHGVYPFKITKDENGNDIIVNDHVMLVTDSQGNSDVINIDPSDLGSDLTLVYDFSDPSGHFVAKQQRGNSTTNDWFGMINLSLTWKFVIPNNSACKLEL